MIVVVVRRSQTEGISGILNSAERSQLTRKIIPKTKPLNEKDK